MTLDQDLQSMQEARDLVKRAHEAYLEYKQFTQAQVDTIVEAMARAGFDNAERLAKMAHEETGFGRWQDKVVKNVFSTKHVWESIKDLKTVGMVRSYKNGAVIEIAEPMGVVAALVPCTNPTSTAMYKAIIALKGRNAIVASPHPRSVKSTTECLRVLDEAAVKAGAPKGLIHCMQHVSREGTTELMQQKRTAVILATGSTAMVRAAQSVGKPAFGVGAGNVPAFIERTANVKKAVADVMTGKKFDNGVLCSTEASVIVDSPVYDEARELVKQHGGFFCEGEDKDKLRRTVFPGGHLNSELVGKPATFIAQQAGIQCPPETAVLVAEIDKVGRDEPLSREKLSPVLSMFKADGWLAGCHRCIELLEFGGIGHTMAIHSSDKEVVMKFALEKPAQRVVVNSVASVGAVGYTNELAPSLTLGPGTIGGSIISENVTAEHLVNVKRVAFETKPMNDERGSALPQDTQLRWGNSTPASRTRDEGQERRSWMKEIEERIRDRAGNPAIGNKPQQPAAKPEVKSGVVLGAGITAEEVQKIISEFSLK
ncbi:MAG: acetaldehyde dehydrogenase [Ectothiorhodospiraceae bacterium]|nr:acetaldehyde dehydrogenase [Ectothiorhodospiraceae bacterium]